MAVVGLMWRAYIFLLFNRWIDRDIVLTIPSVLPEKIKCQKSFSASTVAKAMANKMNTSQMETKLAYIKLNSQKPSVFAH